MNILVAGDYCPHDRVSSLFEKGNYEFVLKEVKEIISGADYSIVNLECPVAEDDEKPIAKIGLNLHCSKSGVEALKWAGFKCVTLANNHFLDFGKEGVKNTLSVCKDFEIDTVGGGNDLQEASKILYKEIDGKTLAIINCCEHEFSISTATTAGSNPLNPIQQYYAILEARQNADYILVIVHGGHEFYQLPCPRMQETYRFFIDVGADAVINHHQHCYSGYEIYKRKPIFYGLGNFCFDRISVNDKKWYEGYMVLLHLNKYDVSFILIPYCQGGSKASVELLGDKEREDFLFFIQKINQVIGNHKILSERHHEYLNSETVNYIFEPYNNRLLLALYRRHLLPSFISEKKKKLLRAYLQCEAHIEKVLNGLQ